MDASAIMTRNVVTVGPETPVPEVVRTMLENRISAVPVLDDGALVGIISEGDLLRRAEVGTEHRRSRWMELAVSNASLAADYVKQHGRKARDVMTRGVTTVAPTTPIAEIAEILESRHIKRVPVLSDGKLVGIVSRAKTFAAITEPVVLFVVFTVALVTGTDLPYALAKTVRMSADQIVRPAHLLAAAALFMVILYETGRIPVETHTGTNEFGMIEEARPFEHSGPYLALLRWGSTMKQLILFVILINVFVAPWGLASDATLVAVGLAILALIGKAALLGAGIAVIDDSFAKLRLFKITEFVSAAFMLAVLSVFTLYFGGG
jgi:CBS domain-containing protein